MRVSTGLFLGSAHVSTSYPAADGLSYFGSSVGFCACVSPEERALFATMSRARQLIEARREMKRCEMTARLCKMSQIGINGFSRCNVTVL